MISLLHFILGKPRIHPEWTKRGKRTISQPRSRIAAWHRGWGRSPREHPSTVLRSPSSPFLANARRCENRTSSSAHETRCFLPFLPLPPFIPSPFPLSFFFAKPSSSFLPPSPPLFSLIALFSSLPSPLFSLLSLDVSGPTAHAGNGIIQFTFSPFSPSPAMMGAISSSAAAAVCPCKRCCVRGKGLLLSPPLFLPPGAFKELPPPDAMPPHFPSYSDILESDRCCGRRIQGIFNSKMAKEESGHKVPAHVLTG